MKQAKKVGLLAVAAAALIALAAPASATTLTSPAGTALGVGDIFEATSTHAYVTGTINITCTDSRLKGKITDQGGKWFGVTTDIEGQVTYLDFTNCGNHTVEVNSNGGTFHIDTLGGGRGTLQMSGTEITVLTHSSFLGTRHCIYETDGTDVGAITGGNPATLAAASEPIDQSTTDSLCGNDAVWDGSYAFTSHKPLLVD